MKKVDVKIVILLVAFFVIFSAYVFPLYQKQINEIARKDVTLLDTRLSYTQPEVIELFTDMGTEGREINRFVSGVVDMVYPIVYGLLFMALLANLTYPFSNRQVKWLRFLPLIIMLFDYSENLGVLRMLSDYPELTADQVRLNSMLTTSKWMFTLLTVTLTIVLGINRLIKRKHK